ncbi:unnamed protein product [Polarella glacialis]|uniref:BTB domain-containing protein n=1 Tax=Polarella glacialis TaxID=89957 RepID=A0A813IXG9_POLGL|nr:unnamed protein product [Polarella glacialis]CAE8657069.1 unnamed protein product [Polarella glacialis]
MSSSQLQGLKCGLPDRPVGDDAPAPKRTRHASGRVTLNVGSQKFETSVETLRTFPSSFFSALASGRHTVNWEEDGSVFIDRSPDHFHLVLQYLRNGSRGIIVPSCKIGMRCCWKLSITACLSLWLTSGASDYLTATSSQSKLARPPITMHL